MASRCQLKTLSKKNRATLGRAIEVYEMQLELNLKVLTLQLYEERCAESYSRQLYGVIPSASPRQPIR